MLLAVAGLVLVVMAILALRAGYMFLSIKIFRDQWIKENQQPADPNTLVIVAMGDSTVQGIGAFMRSGSFVSQVASRVSQSQQKPVQIYNFSVSGAESGDVLKNQIPQLQKLNYVDAVIIAVGPNDITHKKSLESFLENYEKITKLVPINKTVIATLPPMKPKDIHGQSSYQWGQALVETIAPKGVLVAPVFKEVNPRADDPRIYGGDFYHPSREGYRLWANAFVPQIEKIINKKPAL